MNNKYHMVYITIIFFLIYEINSYDRMADHSKLTDVNDSCQISTVYLEKFEASSPKKAPSASETNLTTYSTTQNNLYTSLQSKPITIEAAEEFRKRHLGKMGINDYISFINNLPINIDRSGFIRDALETSFASEGTDKSQLIPLIKQELSTHANDQTLLTSLASIYFEYGNYTKSIQLMEQILSSHPENYDVMYQIGLAYRNMGDEQNSQLFFSQVAQKSPEYHWLIEIPPDSN